MRETGVTEVVKDFFLDEDQRHFSVVEELSLSIFLLLKRRTGSMNLSKTAIPIRNKRGMKN